MQEEYACEMARHRLNLNQSGRRGLIANEEGDTHEPVSRPTAPGKVERRAEQAGDLRVPLLVEREHPLPLWSVPARRRGRTGGRLPTSLSSQERHSGAKKTCRQFTSVFLLSRSTDGRFAVAARRMSHVTLGNCQVFLMILRSPSHSIRASKLCLAKQISLAERLDDRLAVDSENGVTLL
jgi:hypothetical protein